ELSRFDELVSRHLDDALAPAEAAEVVALLAQPILAARFLEMTRLNSEIAGLLAAAVPDAAMIDLVRTDIQKSLTGNPGPDAPLNIIPAPQSLASPARSVAQPHKTAWPTLACAAGFVIFAGIVAFLFVTRTRLAEAPRITSTLGTVRLAGADER